MQKKFFYFSSLSLITIFLLVAIYFNNTYLSFNPSNVKSTIYTLSSDTLNGRLAGSMENDMVAKLIASKFKDYGLTPLNSDYNDNFIVTCPTFTDTTAHLHISNNESIIKSFNYGIDFKEDMINFKENSFTFSKSDIIKTYPSHIEVICPNGKFILYTPKDDDLSFRSSFSKDFDYDLAVMITENVFTSIQSSIKEGNTISLHIPFTTEDKSISNIVGVLEGSDSSLPPLILSAHYDHLGSDGVGNTYSGALDNASGSAFILELCRSLSTYGKPSRDIIFVALNAEEFGLLGSEHFVKRYLDTIKDAESINFDMIGSPDIPITFVQGTNYKAIDSKLLSSLKNISTDLNIDYEIKYQDSSDHASFNKFNIDSVTFCHDDVSKIHTPNDTLDFIDIAAISSAHNIIDTKIKNSCYSSFTKFLYSTKSILFFATFLVIVCALFIFDRKNTLLDKLGIKIFSLVAILFIVLSFMLYLKGFIYAMLVVLIYSFSGIALSIRHYSK